ncbi:MAG: 50S ribosomal protein L4 [Planctomycetota bacterium]
MDVPILDKQGTEVGTLAIDEQSLGGEVNPALIKQAFVMYHANTRQGSARTRSRGMIEGSTKKLFRQKGTGNARMGPKRTPIRKGGGVAFAKTRERESYHQDMPVKMRRKANRNALLAKLVDGEVKVIDDLSFDSPKTRPFREMLDTLGINRSCLVALAPENTNGRLSARNIPGVTVANAHQLTCFELLQSRFVVIAKSDLEAWLDGPSKNTAKGGKDRTAAALRGGETRKRSRPKRGHKHRVAEGTYYIAGQKPAPTPAPAEGGEG